MKKPLLCANWKMNKDPEAARDYLRWILRTADQEAQKHFIFFVPALTAFVCREELAKSPAKWGGQNCYFRDQGAFTGENSPQVLRAMGATYCLVGHSERRHLFGEDDEMVLLKMRALWHCGVQPVLCVGETREEKEKGQSLEVVKRQLSKVLEEVSEFGEQDLQSRDMSSSIKESLKGSDIHFASELSRSGLQKRMLPRLNNLFKNSDMRFAAKRTFSRFAYKAELVLNRLFNRGDSHNLQSSDKRAAESRRKGTLWVQGSDKRAAESRRIKPSLRVAYEPVWAIGTGVSADSEHIRRMCDEIRRLFTEVKQSVAILYGGSVDEGNIAQIFRSSGVDGFLVGGASLKPDRFFQLYKVLQK